MAHHAFLLSSLLLLRYHGVHISHQVCKPLRTLRRSDFRSIPYARGVRWGIGSSDGCQAVIERDELFGAVVDKLFKPCVELVQVCISALKPSGAAAARSDDAFAYAAEMRERRSEKGAAYIGRYR